MRAYLLGMLDDSRAAEIEQRYFASGKFLQQLQDVETELIRDYLAGRLRGGERQSFEVRYLSTSLLNRRVEDVRKEMEAEPSARWSKRPVRFLVGAAMTATLAAVVWVQYASAPRTAARVPGRTTVMSRAVPSVLLQLSPGLEKGSAESAIIVVPPRNARVRIELEMPGTEQKPDCTARLSRTGADGTPLAVWSGSNVHPARGATGSKVEAEVSGEALSPGDYMVELLASDGARLESYAFRVIAR